VRLLFLCSGLEPGRDGVGDYSRRLAVEMAMRGHCVALLALNDKHLASGSAQSQSVAPNPLRQENQVAVLRIPASGNWKTKQSLVSEFVCAFQPDWFSLQYVPYGFQKRGLPFGLASRLEVLAPGANWHVMFHELWVGISRLSPWKHKLTGFFQRMIASDLLVRLCPKVVQTTNPLYVELLRGAGISAECLPLFGNIKSATGPGVWMEDRLREIGIAGGNRDEWFLAGMFGSCYPDYPLDRQVRRVLERAVKLGKKPAFLGIGGGLGTCSEWEGRVRSAAPGAIVRHFGPQQERHVSEFLHSLDLGMPTTPVEMLGKSGSAALMVLHGVPLEMGYSADMPEYRHLGLADYPLEDLFWPVEKVAASLESAMAAAGTSTRS